MMKKFLFLWLFLAVLFAACTDDDDNVGEIPTPEVNKVQMIVVQASVNYNIECNKSGKMDTGSLDSNGNPIVVKGRNNTWQISLGYWF